MTPSLKIPVRLLIEKEGKDFLEKVYKIIQSSGSYKSSEELEKKIEESESQKVLIAENFDHHGLVLLETKIKDLPGFEIKKDIIRDYVDGSTFSHLIGYLNKTDKTGKAGLEKSYEETLKEDAGIIAIFCTV